MSSRIRDSLRDEELHENEVKGLRKRQQVKYYESSSSADDSAEEVIQSRRNKKSRNKSRSSDTDDPNFESGDSDPDENTYQKTGKSSSKKKGTESMSEYEKQLLENKNKNLEFLKTLGIDQAKDDLKELKQKKRGYKRKDIPESSDGPKRVSQREKAHINYAEGDLNDFDAKSELESTGLTFKNVLKFKNYYESFVEDFSEILETDDFVRTPVLYDKDVLKQLSKKADMPSSKFYNPATITWYPSSEHLILAIGEGGNLTLWNVEESDYLHKFSVHSKKVSNVQFNPSNTSHLISSSMDGTLICCDMQKQIFSEVLRISNSCCTYFDFFSPSSYLVSLRNGGVVIVDKRNRGGDSYQQKSYTCHDSSIHTIHVHPEEKNYFVTAGMDRKFCIWDLRKLTKSPIIENTSYSKSVRSAFFSPLSGKYLLTTSHDSKICIYDSTTMTEGRMKLRKFVKCGIDKNKKAVPIWLPNSDDFFSWYNKDSSERLQIYDKDFNIHDTVKDGINGIRMFNKFHPFTPAIATVTSIRGIKISAEKNNI